MVGIEPTTYSFIFTSISLLFKFIWGLDCILRVSRYLCDLASLVSRSGVFGIDATVLSGHCCQDVNRNSGYVKKFPWWQARDKKSHHGVALPSELHRRCFTILLNLFLSKDVPLIFYCKQLTWTLQIYFYFYKYLSPGLEFLIPFQIVLYQSLIYSPRILLLFLYCHH